MYSKGNIVPIKNSASIIQNNLSIYTHPNKKIFSLAIISKNIISLVTIDENDNPIDFKQIIPKPNNSEESQQYSNILEAKFHRVSDKVVFVVLTTKGLFFYDHTGTDLLYFQNSKSIERSLIEVNRSFTNLTLFSNIVRNTPYPALSNLDKYFYKAYFNLFKRQYYEFIGAKGSAVIKPNVLAIGASSKAILLYEILDVNSDFRKNIECVGELVESSLDGGITALASDSDSDFICSSDTSGTIGIWRVKSTKNIKFSYSLREKKSLCECLTIWNKHLVCGYSTGMISIFDLVNKTKICTIFAHARYINSLHSMADRIVSTGEDGYFRVWELGEINGKLKISNSHSERMPDAQICAAHFFKGGNQIGVSIYEVNEVVMFKSN